MANQPWAQVLDTLYGMGGSGDIPNNPTIAELDPDVDLSQKLDLDIETIREGVKILTQRDLAYTQIIGVEEDETYRDRVTLKSDGFQLAHDRDQAQRSRATNQAVTLLTFVLAWVGIAQAMALTARVSEVITGDISTVVTIGAFLILLVIFLGLIKRGHLDYIEPAK